MSGRGTSGPIVRHARNGRSPHWYKWTDFEALYKMAKRVAKHKGLRPVFDLYDLLFLCRGWPDETLGDIVNWAVACLVQLCLMKDAGVWEQQGATGRLVYMLDANSNWQEEAAGMKWDRRGCPKERGGEGKLYLHWKVTPALRCKPFVSGYVPRSSEGNIRAWWPKERYLVPMLFAMRSVIHGGPGRDAPHLQPGENDGGFRSITSALGAEPLAHTGKICGCGICDLATTVHSVVTFLMEHKRPADYMSVGQYQAGANRFSGTPKPDYKLTFELIARSVDQSEVRQVHNDLKNHFLDHLRSPAVRFPHVDRWIDPVARDIIQEAYARLPNHQKDNLDSDSDDDDTHGQEFHEASSDEESSDDDDGDNGGAAYGGRRGDDVGRRGENRGGRRGGGHGGSGSRGVRRGQAHRGIAEDEDKDDLSEAHDDVKPKVEADGASGKHPGSNKTRGRENMRRDQPGSRTRTTATSTLDSIATTTIASGAEADATATSGAAADDLDSRSELGSETSETSSTPSYSGDLYVPDEDETMSLGGSEDVSGNEAGEMDWEADSLLAEHRQASVARAPIRSARRSALGPIVPPRTLRKSASTLSLRSPTSTIKADSFPKKSEAGRQKTLRSAHKAAGPSVSSSGAASGSIPINYPASGFEEAAQTQTSGDSSTTLGHNFAGLAPSPYRERARGKFF